MSVTVGNILDILNEIAPFETCEDYDNVGLLAGHPDWSVERILVALDLTEDVVAEAIAKDAQMIVTHHPVLFRGRKNLREDDPEGRALCALVRGRIAMAAMHTNYDNAPDGLNKALAEELGLIDTQALAHGMQIGRFVQPMTLADAARMAGERLGGVVRVYGRPDTMVSTMAVMGGAGGSFVRDAEESGAQVYLTGEISYHAALDAKLRGFNILEAGHYETEQIAIKTLTNCLQKRLNEVQYRVNVIECAC